MWFVNFNAQKLSQNIAIAFYNSMHVMRLLTSQALPEHIAGLDTTTFVRENKVHSIVLYQFVNIKINKWSFVDLILLL